LQVVDSSKKDIPLFLFSCHNKDPGCRGGWSIVQVSTFSHLTLFPTKNFRVFFPVPEGSFFTFAPAPFSPCDWSFSFRPRTPPPFRRSPFFKTAFFPGHRDRYVFFLIFLLLSDLRGGQPPRVSKWQLFSFLSRSPSIFRNIFLFGVFLERLFLFLRVEFLFFSNHMIWRHPGTSGRFFPPPNPLFSLSVRRPPSLFGWQRFPHSWWYPLGQPSILFFFSCAFWRGPVRGQTPPGQHRSFC